jgi:hypothetical protein
VRVRRQEPARDVALPDAELAVPGQAAAALPEGLDPRDAQVMLRYADAGGAAQVGMGETAALRGARITTSLGEGQLLLWAEPLAR